MENSVSIALWNNFNNKQREQILIELIESLIVDEMDRLIGLGDYQVCNDNSDRFIVSFSIGDVESSGEMANDVVDYVNNSLGNLLRVGNYSETMFWLTWID
jgi:hypothetical protein